MSCHYFLEGERTRIQQQFLKPIFDCQTLYHVHMYLVEFENLVRSGPFVQALIRITLSTAVSRSSITDSQYHNSDGIFFYAIYN